MSKKYREATAVKTYINYKTLKKGKVIVDGAEYLGRAKPNKFDKENFEFKTELGEIISLNESGQLNYLMAEFAKEGDTCRITYLGTEVLTEGKFKGKPAHKFKLEIAEGDELSDGSELEEIEEEEEEEEEEEAAPIVVKDLKKAKTTKAAFSEPAKGKKPAKTKLSLEDIE